MPAFASLTAIYSAALSILGEAQVTPDTTTGTQRGKACELHYPVILESILRDHHHYCVRKIDTLELDTSITVFPPEFPAAYALPADCLRILRVHYADCPLTQFTRLQNHLYTPASLGDLTLEYTSDTIAPEDMPADLALAVVAALASAIAPSVTQDTNRAEQARNLQADRMLSLKKNQARETKSGENSSPLKRAMNSALFLSRFQ